MTSASSPLPALSPEASVVWAKDDKDTGSWLPLHRHMADTEAIAGYLWRDYLPAVTRAIIAADLGGDAAAERCVRWLAAAHDLGKATPAFTIKLAHQKARMLDAGFDFHMNEQARSRMPHSLASHILLRDWLIQHHGFSREVAESYAVVPGSHHGVTPSHQMLKESRPYLLGESAVWRSVQEEFAAYATSTAGVEHDLSGWAATPLSARSQILITAIVIIADWLASNVDLFSYGDGDVRSSEERAERAWQRLQLPPAWKAGEPPMGVRELFESRFSLPPGADVRPMQKEAVASARDVDRPGLMIVEAPMGEGKTEAALAVAEVFAHRTGAGGAFIALPTMATSDAMFTRVSAWVERLSALSGSDQTIFLAHGKAALNEEFAGLARGGRIVEVGNDEGDDLWERVPEQVVIAHEWLMGRKKGPLANFVVGTVDQVLFGALKSRHLMLRHLALVNKVVIIDEVHAYDVYMNVYLDRILGWLGHYGVPVILLSATLPTSRRRELIEAYSSETAQRLPAVAPNPEESMSDRKRRLRAIAEASAAQGSEEPPVDLSYPLITATTSEGVRTVHVDGVSRKQRVSIDRMPDDDQALVDLLETSLGDGGCVMIVRNTVARAQQTMRLLMERFGDRHTLRLAHSRFIASDRAETDAWLRASFGPPEKGNRPGSAIVVGTQVLEQSLDVDFDLLVTDLAPTDLILQRLGRVHRHHRDHRPTAMREPRCVIVGVEDWTASPPAPVTGPGLIYDGYTLLRTLAVIDRVMSSGGEVLLPDDIPKLVQDTYASSADDGPWRQELQAAREEQNRNRESKKTGAHAYLLNHVPRPPMSIIGWQDRGIGDASDDSPGAQAQVRDTEDTLEVLVVRRVGDEIRTLPHLRHEADRMISTEWRPDDPIALAVAQSSIRLPPILSKPWMTDRVVGPLEKNAFTGWQLSPWLKGQLVLVLDEQFEAEVAGHRLRYSREWGLEVERSETT